MQVYLPGMYRYVVSYSFVILSLSVTHCIKLFVETKVPAFIDNDAAHENKVFVTIDALERMIAHVRPLFI